MWEIEGFKALAAKPGVHTHSLHLCMFGGTRPKWSAFLTNIPAFAGIVKTCDGSHSHAPWQSFDTPGGRVFDTASEAKYPPELCHHLAKLVLDLAVERGFEPPPTRHENKEKAPTHWCRWLHHTYPLWQADRVAFNGAGCQAGVMRGGLNECAQGLHLCNAPKCTSRASHGRAGHTAAHE